MVGRLVEKSAVVVSKDDIHGCVITRAGDGPPGHAYHGREVLVETDVATHDAVRTARRPQE